MLYEARNILWGKIGLRDTGYVAVLQKLAAFISESLLPYSREVIWGSISRFFLLVKFIELTRCNHYLQAASSDARAMGNTK